MTRQKHARAVEHIAELERELFPENANKPCHERGYHRWIHNEHGTKDDLDYEFWYSCGDCGETTRDPVEAGDAIQKS